MGVTEHVQMLLIRFQNDGENTDVRSRPSFASNSAFLMPGPHSQGLEEEDPRYIEERQITADEPVRFWCVFGLARIAVG